MKILQVIGSLDMGGAEKLIVDLVPLLNNSNQQCDVLLFNGKKTPLYNRLKETSNVKLDSLGKSFYNPFFVLKLMKYFKKYDIIHVHLFPAQYYVVFAKILSFSKIPIIFTEHSTSNRRLNKKMLIPIERIIYSSYQKIICISNEVKLALIEKLPFISIDKYEVITNGINLKIIEQSNIYKRSQFNYLETDIILVMVAAFRHEKDHKTVFKALYKLPNKYKLILIGDGKDKERAKSEINDVGVKNRVTLLGNRSDVYSILKMCDIAILSSHWEGFGLAAAESMACGIPTIASNVNGLAQVVKDGGILFEKGNEKELFNEILKLENHNYYKIVSDKCKIKAKQYDIYNMVDKLNLLYKSILN